jgi:hypothetical protein
MDELFTSQRERWRRDLEALEEAIDDLLESRSLFFGIREVVAGNQALRRDGMVVDWMFQNYAFRVVVEVRKQIDTDARSVSLMNVLAGIAKCPQALSRGSFLDACRPGNKSIRRIQDERFTELAGSGDCIDVAVVGKDMDELIDLARAIKKVADKIAAHRDRRGPQKLPSYAELHQCVDEIVALFRKYNLLVRATEYNATAADLPSDWSEVFRHPWICEGRDGNDYPT